MKCVLVESPYAGNVDYNVVYAWQCMKDCLDRGEAPFASHLLYTAVLDDKDAAQRNLGIEAGLAWGAKADATVVYIDHGITAGMKRGIDRAEAQGRSVAYRSLRTPGVDLQADGSFTGVDP